MSGEVIEAPVALARVETPDAGALMRKATDVAGVCREIVLRTAMTIRSRKYVKVEGWQAIANAWGCVASARDVEDVVGGVRAIGEVRRIHDGVVIATGEGFVGDDESMWANRPMYARRAMAQTRAISRACRSAFAFVVVLIDEKLSTTPAEEMDGLDEPNDRGFNQPKARNDDWDTNTPPKGNPKPAEPSPLERIEVALKEAQTKADIDRIVPQIRKLSRADQDAVRPLFARRLQEVKRATPKR